MHGKINACMIGIGGALQVVVGVRKKAPNWMRNSGLEWIFRLVQEPRRLFMRYIISNSLYILLFFYEIIKINLQKKV
jgi:N-acetylglucosaminyldiphosphoundecaprenol N-acetyl-beta-D-mannosaminyltransferase